SGFNVGGTTYSLSTISPQELINIFNDSVGELLLPLHPDYCKLEECAVLNDTYDKRLAAKKTHPMLAELLEKVIEDDSILDSMDLPKPEFKKTVNDDRQIDSLAFLKTICGSESGTIEDACMVINKYRGPNHILEYSQ